VFENKGLRKMFLPKKDDISAWESIFIARNGGLTSVWILMLIFP
jgi:hypothetical protein